MKDVKIMKFKMVLRVKTLAFLFRLFQFLCLEKISFYEEISWAVTGGDGV